ncbi:uncharacterized protein L969DRAFT_21530 [Mixia osmundae IAM 14324]|uniref:Xylulose 5-phosphate/Fructose 6-phosphate phosphoketolase N-terminal domain-containing protein n=1 Tax=Mixia osmundae (strain CBS 9802 / IAM 14324 / JCM 22182 / KY 12970) TaxID=764103 RepID=G7E566_MIXOS|nr:uncharacterized protein L969DRAFT_21530 [Mixia osmundae IAM 14324]KEI42667.1 hypothetical protein L969DRAFT_21530 [Mixia osmundae IAM 14324]GAA97976.1 hypothetical protein E5Q_04656 [Mixia osmundae IAM 14324]
MGHAEGSTEPKSSSLPDLKSILGIKLDTQKLGPTEKELESLETFQRACNFMAVSQIFLNRSAVDPSTLEKRDVKRRLLGHFGTCPGLALVWAHTNLLIQKEQDSRFLMITGPGHGAPAILAGVYLEGSMTRFYPQYSLDKTGFNTFIRAFSWPGGIPSHVNADTPGAIHEGGELGYALGVAYGSVMDNPDLISVVVVGDGEAETATTATSWHCHKFIDPAESGAVIPILHVNGFKISERTLFGTMDDNEVLALFTGYGYQCAIVEYEDVTNPGRQSDIKIQVDMWAAMQWCYAEIKKIQTAARSGKPMTKPRWPMIVLRSPKGWTGPLKVDGMPMVNSFRSHQIPLPKCASDDEQFEMLKKWLSSYHPESLFDESKSNIIRPEVLELVPKDEGRRLGLIKDAWNNYRPLDLPADWKAFASDKLSEEISPMKAIAKYLEVVIEKNPKDFRIFSPDELASNKLNSVLEKTNRNMQWDPETANRGGRVIEVLSENMLQAFCQGYTLTGRTGLFPSYEAFLMIIDTMLIQYVKFIKVAQESGWRSPNASLNYIETSTLWRQEHNGYSHQQPGLIDVFLDLPQAIARVYLPPDGNSAVSVINHCLRSKNYVNLIVGSKTPGHNFLTIEETEKHCVAGISVWGKHSTDDGKDPDVVLCGIGVEVTTEVVAAVTLLKKEAPEIRVRVVNVVDLLVLAEPGEHPHALDQHAFESIFTADKPVIVSFHGYPNAVRALISGRSSSPHHSRFTVLGYMEKGTTTSPFSMLRVNGVGRYDLAIHAVRATQSFSPQKLGPNSNILVAGWQHKNRESERYAEETGDDPPELKAAVLYEA